MKKTIFVLTLILSIILLPSESQARKPLPAYGKTVKAPVTSSYKRRDSGISISVSSGVATAGCRAIYLNISNANSVSDINYTLMYESEGVPQGIGGSISNNSGASISRELVLGTASSGNYRCHVASGIRLEVSYKKDGKTYLRKYRIR